MKLFTVVMVVYLTTAAAQQLSTNVKYETGSLPLSENTKLSLTVTPTMITFTQGTRQLTVATERATSIFYGSKVRDRTKKSTAALGSLAGPLPLLLRKPKSRYIGISWTDSQKGDEGGAVLKFDSEKQYRMALQALTSATGRQPVNTDTVSGGR